MLKVVQKFDGQILTNALCEEMIKELIKFKWFKSKSSMDMLDKTDPRANEKNWNEYWKSEKPFTDKEAYKIINTWKPSRTWPGFRGSPSDPHWAHRWHQYFAELKIYGLVYYEAPGKGEDEDKFAKPFEITELGNRLIKAIPEDEVAHDAYQTDSITVDEQIIFCHIMAKFESSNPFRRVSFQNSSLPLLLSALLTLKNIGEKPHISHSEMLLLIYWKNNNPKELANYLKLFRSKKINKDDMETVERVLIQDLKLKGSPFTDKKSRTSAIDAYWRRLRATGLFVRKGFTYILDLNEIALIKYIIKAYLPIKTVGFSEKQYANYASTIDRKILSYKQKVKFANTSRINAIANYLSWDQIKNELTKCYQSGRKSTIAEVDGLKASLRYEFFCAVAIAKKFKNTKVKSNCKTDSFGWPISFASGMSGTNTGADIECFEQNMNFIVEPSLGTSKSEQTRECLAIDDHLDAFINQQTKDAKSFFIAPAMTSRAKNFSRFLDYERKGPVMKNLTTKEFIDKLESENNLYNSFVNKP